MDHFILDEGSQCCKDRRDKIFFFKDEVENKPCKTTNVKVMSSSSCILGLRNFEDEIFIRRGECSDPNN